jgi:hypothetical protein
VLSEKGKQKKKEIIKKMKSQNNDDWKDYFSELNERGKAFSDFMMGEEPEVPTVPEKEIKHAVVEDQPPKKDAKTTQLFSSHGLSDQEEVIKTRVIEEVIKKAYFFATSGGKTKIQDLNKSITVKKDMKELFTEDLGKLLTKDVDKLMVGERKSKHLEKIKKFIKSGFEKEFSGDKVVLASKEKVARQILGEVAEIFSEIELDDKGAIHYMKNLIKTSLLPANGHNTYSRS